MIATMRLQIILCLILKVCVIYSAQAADNIPVCRYDNSLIPVVKQAVDWAIAEYRANSLKLPFEHVVYNTTSDKKNVLSVYLVKDATLKTVDSQGCIKDLGFQVHDSILRTDGDCIPTDRSKCSPAEKVYMQKRFIDIHGGFGDSQTGYELTGACYMTNLQACVHRDRLEFLKLLGARDKISVKGGCVASAIAPMSIHCSAGALKMLLSREAATEKAPTLGILFMLSHELGHLIKSVSSTYDFNDYTVDRTWSKEDKFAVLRRQCTLGNSLRRQEEEADNLAILVAGKYIEEISNRWPQQGSAPWLVTQTGHFSTNLVRWNNDWQEGEVIDVPDVFKVKSKLQILDDKDLAYLDKDVVPSGYSKTEVRINTKIFLCDLAQKRQGKWFILIQSGTTHGTMVERISEVIGRLRTKLKSHNDPVSKVESLTGKVSDLVLRRHRAYLREIEEQMCDLIDESFKCPGQLSEYLGSE